MNDFLNIHEIRLRNTRDLMKAEGLSRADFAEKIGLSYNLLSQYIGKTPTKNIGDETSEKIEQALEQVGLAGMENRHPDNLSGGQQARVALLRTLLSAPKAILLDEPFSKLDTQLRVDTRQLVFEQIRTHKLPAIMVTHDYSDAEAAKGKVIHLDL